VQVTGSIKFDLKIDEQLLPRAKALRAQWGAEQRPVWIAASTHEGEDALILQAHRQLLQVHGDALLILVPRHPERFNAVHVLCSEQFATVRRSAGTPVDAQTQVLLGDTMGELLFLYALADIAFVGGSLVATGGHNPLEPAALALPVLMGPHVFNFLEISAMLREAGALQQVDDADGLAGAVRRLVELPQDAQRMGEAGRAVMRANQGALQRLLDGLGALLR
jgi:3-deoxy-D-manno-octulosonic-acid transferase